MFTTPKQQQDKAQTTQKKQNQQNTSQQHHSPGEANKAKSLEISPVFFKKKSGNQSKSIKMLRLPVPLLHLVLEEK